MKSKQRMFLHMIVMSVLRRRSRMIVALLAIVVGATILSGLVTIYYDVPRQMGAQFRNYGANMIFTPTEGTYLTKADVESGLALIERSEMEGYAPFRYETTKIHNFPITIAATDFAGVKKTSPYWHVSGETPTADGETLVGAKVAETLGLKVGDTVQALNAYNITDWTEAQKAPIPSYEIYNDPETGEIFCDHVLDLKITGILETGGQEEKYLYTTLSDVAYLTLNDRGYDLVEVSVAASQDKLQGYAARISASNEGLTAKLVKRVTASESTVLTKLQSLVFIVTAVVLVLTMICVATTMTAVIAERRKEIGLRKAIGASNGSIVAEFMGEGLFLGGIGGILGSVLGYAFAEIVSINVFSGSIILRWWLVPITIVASVVVTGLACLLPIRSAVEVDPALVLKGE